MLAKEAFRLVTPDELIFVLSQILQETKVVIFSETSASDVSHLTLFL